MRRYIRLAALVLLAVLLFSACGGAHSRSEVKIESIQLSEDTAELKEGEKIQLSVNVIPANATESYSWKSENGDVAAVTANGVVTAIAPGKTNIVASSKSGKKAVCTITVAEPTAYEKLNAEEAALFDHLTETVLEDFYNPMEVRVSKIYKLQVNLSRKDYPLSVLVVLEGNNKRSAAAYHNYGIFETFDGSLTSEKYGDAPDMSQPMPEDKIDPAKLNAALEEYWNEMHG